MRKDARGHANGYRHDLVAEKCMQREKTKAETFDRVVLVLVKFLAGEMEEDLEEVK